MPTWSPSIPKLTVVLAADGVSCTSVPDLTVDFVLGMNAEAKAWPVPATRLKDAPADTTLLGHPAGLFTFRDPPPVSPSRTKKRGQLVFNLDLYNKLIANKDADALNLAAAWNGGRLELEVAVKKGLASEILLIDLAV